nr:hypothetical protein BAU18_04100 [Enterococcus diestrammenae]
MRYAPSALGHPRYYYPRHSPPVSPPVLSIIDYWICDLRLAFFFIGKVAEYRKKDEILRSRIDMTVAFKIEMNYLELVALVTLTLSLKLKGKAKGSFAHTVTSKQKALR